MSVKKIHNLIIDPELRRLCPEASTEEYTIKEAEVIFRGCPHPIEVWNDIVLYDFTYYDICHSQDIPFQIQEINLLTRYDAIYYACMKILGTYDLSQIYYRYVVGRGYQAIKRIMADSHAGRRKCPFEIQTLNLPSTPQRGLSAEIASKVFHLGLSTAPKYGTYARALDEIAEKVPVVADELLNKTITLSIDETILLSKRSKAEILIERDRKKNRKKTLPAKDRFAPSMPLTRRRKSKPEIKQMPKFDPDAEISSLTLTIPTWISSIKRTAEVANFQIASPTALQKLTQQLDSLTDVILKIQTVLGGTENE